MMYCTQSCLNETLYMAARVCKLLVSMSDLHACFRQMEIRRVRLGRQRLV